MKANEILSALKLDKTKETMNFCGKLSNLFALLKLIVCDIVKAVIMEGEFTVSQAGKLLTLKQVRLNYIENRVSHYTYNDKEMKGINESESNLYKKLADTRELLHKKRKNKDNSALENQKTELENKIKEIAETKEGLIANERTRLEGLQFDIKVIRRELQLFTAHKFNVTTDKGSYSFFIPVNNAFYIAVCNMLNIQAEVGEIKKREEIMKIVTYPDLLINIKKALPFVSNDDLRPAMTCICLDFSEKGIQVVSTDAHRMYYSSYLGGEVKTAKEMIFTEVKNCKPFQLLISQDGSKKLAKLKAKNDNPLEIVVFKDNTATFNGIEVNLLTEAKYPQFRVVIPEYEQFMEFERELLIKKVKNVLPYTNASTKQVNFHLNGDISLKAADVDFSFECETDMPYVSKQFKDTDIAFNGNFLNEILGIFPDKNIKMYSEGQPTKAAIFSNGTDNALLMPLMIGDKW